ncbi:MAG: hypothetical protein AAF721_23255 [Myxococcota bacterium]
MTGAALVAAVSMSVALPATVIAAPSISPETAGEKRDAIRESAAKHGDKEDWEAMADALESNAKLIGDPVTLMESAEARMKFAEAEGDTDICEQARETTNVALDILHFYDSVSTGGARSRWKVIDPDLASGLISDAEAQLEQADECVESIENAAVEEEDGAVAAGGGAKKAKKKKEKKKRGPAKPGTVLIGVGAGVAVLGLAGIGVGVAGLASGSAKQKEVEDLIVPEMQDEVDKLDEEGKRANLLGIVGMAVGGGLLLAGGALLVVGVLKRKKAGNVPAAARINVSPMIGRSNGLAIQGRF